MCAYSGIKTGRSPTDKRIVLDDHTKDEIWWGDVNRPISQESFQFCNNMAINYLNNKRRLYVVDGYAGWDPEYRIKVRVLCTRSYHALFMNNMMIMPTRKQLETDFADDEQIDFHIFNAGEYQVPLPIEGVTSPTTV